MQGDAERVWSELSGRVRPFVASRVASSADVDDVMQDVFVRMSRGLGAVGGEKLAPWLFQVARSAIAEHYRARARHPLAREDDDAEEGLAAEPTVIADDEFRDVMTHCVALFVTMLPSPYREAITLTELEGMSQKDAAAMLGISHSGMKSRVQRGREQLRQMFEQACALDIDARRRVVNCTPRGCGGCSDDADDSSSKRLS